MKMEKTINTIEELQNLVVLLQEVLKFYGDSNNYRGTKSASSCCGGTPFSLIDVDEGSQARAALERVKELVKENQKIQDEYDKFMAGYEQLQANEGIADTEELIKVFKTMGDDKNV